MARKRNPANIVGPLVARHRMNLGWTQERFAAECRLAGWVVSRGTLSHIELRLRLVKDFELLKLSQVLNVPIAALFPGKEA